MHRICKLSPSSLFLLTLASPAIVLAESVETDEQDLPEFTAEQLEAAENAIGVDLNVMVVTAAEELKQAPGVSVISADDIRKRPPVNDLSDIIRKMPGVNLSGNSSSGQYGNNRQIDIRGMGPENTLILIDGKPVRSRNSVRMGRSGERNTRGDTNWVPAELVERIEVLRGPAAARYGSGAMGGVVNIITKSPTDETHGSVSYYMSRPESDYEGQTDRYNFSLTGPVGGGISYRLHGNLNKTDADDPGLNKAFLADGATTPPAGKEGVRNRDLNGMLRWDITPDQRIELEGGYSRQGNIYAGDRAVSTTGSETLNEKLGSETNIMYRTVTSLTYKGDWDWGSSQLIFSYENTRNRRLNEGLAGGVEGSINSEDMSTSENDNYSVSGELNIPSELWGINKMTTYGFEYTKEVLDDPYSISQNTDRGGALEGASGKSEATNENIAFFVESNMYLTDRWILTPGLRFDHHTQFSDNWSPSLNTSYDLTDSIQLKGGIARALKAPNLYQSNTSYVYYTRGNGCPSDSPNLGGGCYVQGNDDLQQETSWNLELGVAYNDSGWSAGITYFRNSYENKVIAGLDVEDYSSGTGGTSQVLKWTNAEKAIVAGWEGNLTIPIFGMDGDILSLSNNFTYMIENNDKRTGEPLSVIPKFTVNSILDWQVTEAWNTSLSMTLYGYQKPRSLSTTGAAEEGAALKVQGGYTLFSLSSNYDLGDHFSFGAGINNLFDKEIKRQGTNSSNGAGASSYNEPGRAYFATIKMSF